MPARTTAFATAAATATLLALATAAAADPALVGVVDLLQRIDRVLEALLDVMRTLTRLFGEGAEG